MMRTLVLCLFGASMSLTLGGVGMASFGSSLDLGLVGLMCALTGACGFIVSVTWLCNTTRIPVQTLRMRLADADQGWSVKPLVRVTATPKGVSISAEGYGEKCAADGFGEPIFLEQYQGELRLAVWADIDQEDPTHVIPLGGAKECLREQEGRDV